MRNLFYSAATVLHLGLKQWNGQPFDPSITTLSTETIADLGQLSGVGLLLYCRCRHISGSRQIFQCTRKEHASLHSRKMKRLILKVRPRETPTEPNPAASSEVKFPNESMFNKDGAMRIMPGWTQVERYNEQIGKNMPYARKRIQLSAHHEASNLLWSEKSSTSRQVMLHVDDLPCASDPEPLPLLAPDKMRTVILSDGTTRRNLDFIPFPIYKFHEGEDPRIQIPDTIDDNEKRRYDVQCFYPLFKVDKVQDVVKRRIQKRSSRRKEDWDYGPWSLNDRQAGIWQATHPDVKLVQFEDGRWSHADFFQREYVTSLGTRYTDSSLERGRDAGLFEVGGEKYVWKLSQHCQDIQLFEAHMDKQFRSLEQSRASQSAHGAADMDTFRT